MRWTQVMDGGFFLAIAFGILFTPTFGKVIQVCTIGNPEVVAEGMAGAVSYLSTCDEQLERLTKGFNMPLLVNFFGLAIPGAWFLLTGLQSRCLIGMKEAQQNIDG